MYTTACVRLTLLYVLLDYHIQLYQNTQSTYASLSALCGWPFVGTVICSHLRKHAQRFGELFLIPLLRPPRVLAGCCMTDCLRRLHKHLPEQPAYWENVELRRKCWELGNALCPRSLWKTPAPLPGLLVWLDDPAHFYKGNFWIIIFFKNVILTVF